MTTDAGTPRTDAVVAPYIGQDGVSVDECDALLDFARTLERSLTAAEAERDALRQAMSFAQGAIEDAIYTEDGLDGETGERVLHIIQEAVERGTFDQTQIGGLPRPMLETENDALRARVAGLEAELRCSSDLLDEASSPYIDGCGHDLEWCEQRDSTVAEARALLAPSSSEGTK